MSFEELGAVLRAEREKRGLSLDNVAEHLKISARLLRALEEGDESSLPHTVYVRGFVRSYGNFLGLNSEELQDAMTALSDDEQDVQPTSVYVTPEVDSGRGGSGKLFLVVFVVLCLAGAAVFWFYRDADLFSDLQQARLTTAQPAPPLNAPAQNTPPASPATPGKATKEGRDSRASAPAAPQVAAVQPAAPAQVAQGTQAGQPAQAGAAQSTAAQAPLQQAPLPSAVKPSAVQQPAASGQATQAAAPQTTAPAEPAARDTAPVSGHNKIIITALAECWIHSNADGTDTRQFSLRKGDTFALTFADKLVLKLGNAGGVRLRYNGEDLPAQGKDGQVRTLTFPLSAPASAQ